MGLPKPRPYLQLVRPVQARPEASPATWAIPLFLSILALIFALWGGPADAGEPSTLAPGQHLVTLLSTNDIHGGVEAQYTKTGQKQGGLAFLAGVVSSIRQGLEVRFGADRAGVVLADGGDQFQGTLISNYDEGQLVIAAMNVVGYDAAVPGNHDYDFGPLGWLLDKVTPDSADQNPRGALERLVKQARFPLISANTYFKASVRDFDGRVIPVSSSGCGAATPEESAKIDWTRAERPGFLTPYVIKNVGGVRVALIGIDHLQTPTMTTIDNVTDLCFRDEVASYLEVQSQLASQADVFVMVIHNGNAGAEKGLDALVHRLVQTGGAGKLHAVVAGHTHQVHQEYVDGVPITQSGTGGRLFGRVDLVVDPAAKTVRPATMIAGVLMPHDSCGVAAKDFCAVLPSAEGVPGQTGVPAPTGVPAYEGVATRENADVLGLVAEARARIAPMAHRHLGHAGAAITRDRTRESALANALTDAMRVAAGADVSFVNTGGIRADLPAGDVTYEQLFEVIPFGNRTVVLAPMPAPQLVKLLDRAARTCGAYGALMQSGLRVVFEKDCTGNGNVDEKARLLHVETVGGEVLLDVATGVVPSPSRLLKVATLDFLAAGGSGYSDFTTSPVERDLGIFREVLADELEQHPVEFSSAIDGRWVENKRP